MSTANTFRPIHNPLIDDYPDSPVSPDISPIDSPSSDLYDHTQSPILTPSPEPLKDPKGRFVVHYPAGSKNILKALVNSQSGIRRRFSSHCMDERGVVYVLLR